MQVNGKCLICGRDNVGLREYSFGLIKSSFSLETGKMEDNPNFRTIIVCSTDIKLINKIEDKVIDNVDRVIELATQYRYQNPIEPTQSGIKTWLKGKR